MSAPAIDHFRGFDEYYAIPAKDQTAEFGKWEKGPGIGLFAALSSALGKLDVIVEDLGYITESVRELVRAVGFPNMKVLEFAFDAKDNGPRDYLPYNYDKNCVVYTGTHDNETLRGWLDSIPKADYGMIEKYLGRKVADKDEMVAQVIRLAQASAANLCIIPMQDYLCLDNRARINEPSTLGKNWRWRLLPGQLTPAAGLFMKKLTKTYGRMPSAKAAANQLKQDAPAGMPTEGSSQEGTKEQAAAGAKEDAGIQVGAAQKEGTAVQAGAAQKEGTAVQAGTVQKESAGTRVNTAQKKTVSAQAVAGERKAIKMPKKSV